ncbi:MAG: HipA domain-containing protein [Vallitaleaceae bacterium]|nr:HipA domain-containing protein [Vallitaleaceae bacterium]
MDYSIYSQNKKLYSGAERKIGVTVGSEDYILKFRKKERFLTRNNHISEYLGCRIMATMGYEVQETYLGTYKGEEVVAIKDFVAKGQQFVAFNDVGESSIEEDREKFTYDYEGITDILLANNKLADPQNTISQFWELYILDALLGNFDRHGGNWGFIKENNEYRLAPIFDNGSCLFPKMIDEDEMAKIIADQSETEMRVFTFPTSQILLNGKKSSYYEVISSMAYKECNDALIKVYEQFNMEAIVTIIDSIKHISETHKAFYKHMIKSRFSLIIRATYERMNGN